MSVGKFSDKKIAIFFILMVFIFSFSNISENYIFEKKAKYLAEKNIL